MGAVVTEARSKLRSWLRQVPQPHEVRIRDADDEERTIALSENLRNRWKQAEQAILGAKARHVECLDAKGKILRALELESDDDEPDDPAAAPALGSRAFAQVLDRYGDRMNEAFARGAEAAAQSQDNLVALVEVLTGHLSMAITNLHNVSVNLATVLSAKEDGENPNGALAGNLVTQLLGAAAMNAAKQAAAPPSKDGKP